MNIESFTLTQYYWLRSDNYIWKEAHYKLFSFNLTVEHIHWYKFHLRNSHACRLVEQTFGTKSFWLWIRVRSHERRNEFIPVWDFKPAWKQVQVYMTFHFDCILKRPDIFMDMSRHFISGSVYIIQCFITRNKISFLPKWPQWNNTYNVFQKYMHIKRNIQPVCAYSFRFS